MKIPYTWFPPLDRLYGAKCPVDPKRDIYQGDIYSEIICCRFPYRDSAFVEPKQPRGHGILLGHPCEIAVGEKGDVQPWRTVCPVFEDRDHVLTLDGETHFFAFLLPNLRDDGALWYVDFRFPATVRKEWLRPENRIASLSGEGWHALQRRFVHFHTRVVIDWADLKEAGEGLHPDGCL